MTNSRKYNPQLLDTMEVIVFEKEAYKALRKELLHEMYEIVKNAKEEALRNADPANDWISPQQAHLLLGIKSKTTMQELRDLEQITYSIAGRRIKYSKKSILAYLERNIPKY